MNSASLVPKARAMPPQAIEPVNMNPAEIIPQVTMIRASHRRAPTRT